MSSEERDALADAIEALTPPQSLRVMHRAIIVDQNENDVGVKLRDADAPTGTAKPVPIWYGLPGFSAEFIPDEAQECAIGFHGGAENRPFAALFPAYPRGLVQDGDAFVPPTLPLVKLSFGAGTKPIARVDDTVSCGKIYLRQTPAGPGGVPSILAISYKPFGAVAELPIATIPIPGPMIPLSVDPDNPDPTVACIVVDGKITSGREEFLA